MDNNDSYFGGNMHIRASYYCNGADIAEMTETVEPLEKGEVVSLDTDQEGKLRRSSGAYDRNVAGVVSTEPAIVLNSGDDFDLPEGEVPLEQLDAVTREAQKVNIDGIPLALAGRAPVKATTENGPIRVGDLLVASSKPGYAMKGDDEILRQLSGVVIGKAMESLDEGEGEILVLISL